MQPIKSNLLSSLSWQHHSYSTKHHISLLTIISHIWDLEAFSTVPLVGPELDPKPLGAGGESDGTFICLASLVGCHRVGESCEVRIYTHRT